jgi:hypothetical protein
MTIEANQGTTEKGRVFGFDHARNNFVEWAISESDKIVVAHVEHDDQSSKHGSLSETRRDAMAIAAKENRLPSSQLRMAIRKASQ